VTQTERAASLNDLQPDTGIAVLCCGPTLTAPSRQALLASVPAETEATLRVAFTLQPVNQFDQAGAMVWVDEQTWVKAGIEWCDGEPKISCVVTNDGFSDWSTQLYPGFDGGKTVSLRLRLHKVHPGPGQGPALVVEVADVATPDKWAMIRIASLRSGDKPWEMGLMTFAPMAAGCHTRFTELHLGPKEKLVHDADASEMVHEP
jgi:regulation of enolase protein 1 (concanavalin A-like superfamily)